MTGHLGVIVRQQMRRARGGLVLALVCLLGSTICTLLTPWPLKVIFDHVLLDRPVPGWLEGIGWGWPGGRVGYLLVVSLGIPLIAVLRGLCAYGQLSLTSAIGHRVVAAIRCELFAHLQRLSLAFYGRARAGELLTKVTADTNALRDVLSDSIVTLVSHLFAIAGIFAVMLFLNWRLALIVLGTAPVLSYAVYRLQRGVRAAARVQRRREGRLSARLAEMLSSVALIQAFGRERYEEERFGAENAATLTESIRIGRLEGATARALEMIGAGGTWAVVVFGFLQVLDGRMTPGDVLVFSAYLSHFYKPVRMVSRIVTKLTRAAVSAERLAEIFAVEPQAPDTPGALAADDLKGEIVFDRVSFDYGDGKPVLEDVSFRIPRGQRTVIVGISGAGKSTLVSLILRLHEPTSGTVSIDGVSVAGYRRESLRRQIAIVLQDSTLWAASVAENIAYGKPGATRDEIVAAARAVHAHEFITSLEHGYDTIVGERGTTLSGGQRQRVAMARALVRNAPILILDEPMRGLDAESEARIHNGVERLTAGRTCILITHELRDVDPDDLVLLLERGRIAAQGRHRDLLATSRRYRRMHALAAADRVTPAHANLA